MRYVAEIIQELKYSISWVYKLNLFFINKKSKITGLLIPYKIEKEFYLKFFGHLYLFYNWISFL